MVEIADFLFLLFPRLCILTASPFPSIPAAFYSYSCLNLWICWKEVTAFWGMSWSRYMSVGVVKLGEFVQFLTHKHIQAEVAKAVAFFFLLFSFIRDLSPGFEPSWFDGYSWVDKVKWMSGVWDTWFMSKHCWKMYISLPNLYVLQF